MKKNRNTFKEFFINKAGFKALAAGFVIVLILFFVQLPGNEFNVKTKSEKKPVLIGIQYQYISRYDKNDEVLLDMGLTKEFLMEKKDAVFFLSPLAGEIAPYQIMSKDIVVKARRMVKKFIKKEKKSFENRVDPSKVSGTGYDRKVLLLSKLVEDGESVVLKKAVVTGKKQNHYDLYAQLMAPDNSGKVLFIDYNGERFQDVIFRINASNPDSIKIKKINVGFSIYNSGVQYNIGYFDLIENKKKTKLLSPVSIQTIGFENREIIETVLEREWGASGGVIADEYIVLQASEGALNLTPSDDNVLVLIKDNEKKTVKSGEFPVHMAHGELYLSTRVPMALSPDKRHVAFTAIYPEPAVREDGSNYYERKLWLALLNLEDNSVRKISPAGSRLSCLISWNPVHKDLIAVAGQSRENGLELVNIKTKESMPIGSDFGVCGDRYEMKWSPNGEKLAYLNYEKQIMIYDLKSGKTSKTDQRKYNDFFWVE